MPTKCICHKGFSGYSIIVSRSNFRIGGQETAPQSLTAYTLDRYKQAEKKDNDTMKMKFLLHKDNEKKENPAHKSKSVAALPCNRPFAATHMLFCRYSR